jgi:hypothetical protein
MPPFNKAQIFTLTLQLSPLHAPFGLGGLHLPCFLDIAGFGEADFHKIKGRETLSKSHDLNTAE